MSTFTATKNLELVSHGGDVGTWDTPTNNNWSIVDSFLGGATEIALNNSNIVLSAPQFQSSIIVFNSTLTGNVSVTLPTSFTGIYNVVNLCTGSSAFTVTLTTSAVGLKIALPPQDFVTVRNDSFNVYFTGLPHVGTYWDYAGSSMPNWVLGCTIQPYLNCDGTSFSSAFYPHLANILGGTTLPDARGRFRTALNQGTGRITSGAGGGVDGNTIRSAGGIPSQTLVSGNIPPVPFTDPGHSHAYQTNTDVSFGSFNAGGFAIMGTPQQVATSVNFTNITLIGNTSPTSFNIVPPAYVGGLVLVRAG